MTRVELVSVTHPEINDLTNPEDLIVYCARVSNPENQLNKETAPRLVNFLIKHKHWSPFELVDMTVEIQTSRAIAAQILRHRSFSFQEFSQRYSKVQTLEPCDLRYQAEKNRQSSSEPVLEDSINNIAGDAIRKSLRAYNDLIDAGVSKETARGILPLCASTTMYMKGSVRSWIHYITLRTEENTQEEHRDVANMVKNIFVAKFPNVSEALGW